MPPFLCKNYLEQLEEEKLKRRSRVLDVLLNFQAMIKAVAYFILIFLADL